MPIIQRRFQMAQVAGRQHDADAALDAGQQRCRRPIHIKARSNVPLSLHVPDPRGDLRMPLAHQGGRYGLGSRCGAADFRHQDGERTLLTLAAVAIDDHIAPALPGCPRRQRP
jgi:hypothetical protein